MKANVYATMSIPQKLDRLKRISPELHKQTESGKMSLRDAIRKCNEKTWNASKTKD